MVYGDCYVTIIVFLHTTQAYPNLWNSYIMMTVDRGSPTTIQLKRPNLTNKKQISYSTFCENPHKRSAMHEIVCNPAPHQNTIPLQEPSVLSRSAPKQQHHQSLLQAKRLVERGEGVVGMKAEVAAARVFVKWNLA